MVVREAILREILRGGQVYYLWIDVENDSRKPPNGWQNWCQKRGSPSVTGRCASANWNG